MTRRRGDTETRRRGDAPPLLLLACFFLLLPGCDEREEKAPPPLPSLSGFSTPNKAPGKGQPGPDADWTADQLRIKQLEKFKEAQAKAIKAQQEQIKKLEKDRKKEAKEDQDGKGSVLQVIGGSSTKVLEVDHVKEGHDKDKVKAPIQSSLARPQNVELTGPGKPKSRLSGDTASLGAENGIKTIENGGTATAGKPQEQPQRGLFDRLFGRNQPPPRDPQVAPRGTDLTVPAPPHKKPPADARPPGRSTAEMERLSTAVDELNQRQTKPTILRQPIERHTTVSNQLNEILATKRLQAAAEREQEKEKAADPAKKNAEVVELAAGAGTPARAQEKANPAPQQAGASPALPGAVAGTPDSGQENSASAADEAVLEERYQAGLAARDVVAREASFQQAAIQRREDAIPFLLEELRQNNLLAALAVDCLGAIGRLTEEVEAGLLHGLASRETAVRQTCAYTLAKLRSQHAVQPLIEALKTEKNYPVRCAYLAALGGLGDREALPALKAKLAQQDEVEFVKSAAALALARLGDPAGRAHLVHDLQAPEPSLQVVGLEGLAQLNEPGIAGYLNMGLESPYEEVWTTAAFLMPQLGPGEALPVLRTRLDSPSETIRRRAALAMGFVGSDEALPLIERAVRVGGLNERVMGCALLSNLGRTDQVPLLLEKLQDPHTSVRQTAAVSLARLGAKESVPALLEAARGLKSAGGLPPGLRGAGPDAGERLVLLSCARYLRGEKKDLAISSLPNLRDNTWPEVDRALAEQQVELVKLYQFVDVVADGARALGVVLKPPEGKEQMFREGEHVASGFKVREIGLPIEGKDKAKMPPYVILMRGADRIILAPGRPAEVDVNRQ